MAHKSALGKSGSTTHWRKIRALIIKRDGCCQICGTEENLTVDHVIPRRLGGTDELWNLQVLCKMHNSMKGGSFFDSAGTQIGRAHV